jgi:hypothetical protein
VTGKIEEQEFWTRLVERFPTIDDDYAKTKLISVIKPLPALEEIPAWSRYANIHLLSNHRIEWVKHTIRPIESYINSITISSEVGFANRKPIYIYPFTPIFAVRKRCYSLTIRIKIWSKEGI